MSNRVNQAVPEDLRPDDWAALCVAVAQSGWGVDAAAENLADAVTRAQGKGYIAATMKRMIKEGPRANQGPSERTRTKLDAPLWTTSDRVRRIEPHEYDPVSVCEYAGQTDPQGQRHDSTSCFVTYCSQCGLPHANRVHTALVAS